MNLKKGFTLIELLVVIAIIGILSSVVLASLSTARNKGADARIQSQLQAMRAQAELYSANGAAWTSAVCVTNSAPIAEGTTQTGTTRFGTLFSDNGGLGKLLVGLTSAQCASAAGTPSNGAQWAVAAPLATTGYWCVDSTGVSKANTTAASLAAVITGTSCTP